jgi:recombination protein RecT
MSNQSTALVSNRDKQTQIKDLLERAKPSIAAVLPKHLTPDRLLKIALACTSRTPLLLACNPQSLLLAVMQAAELGLEAGGLLGEAYLVPYKDKATLIVGYRGMIKLARQSGNLSSLEAHCVHANDAFEIEYGLENKLVHKPCMAGVPGDVVAVYAIARFKDGAIQVDVMTRAEVDVIRDRSKSGNDGPWKTDFEEMAKKTVVRRLCKYLPLSPELARAIEHEASVEQNVASPLVDMDVIDVPPGVDEVAKAEATDAKQSRADKIKDAVVANGSA